MHSEFGQPEVHSETLSQKDESNTRQNQNHLVSGQWDDLSSILGYMWQKEITSSHQCCLTYTGLLWPSHILLYAHTNRQNLKKKVNRLVNPQCKPNAAERRETLIPE